jgi:hypothetical protein
VELDPMFLQPDLDSDEVHAIPGGISYWVWKWWCDVRRGSKPLLEALRRAGSGWQRLESRLRRRWPALRAAGRSIGQAVARRAGPRLRATWSRMRRSSAQLWSGWPDTWQRLVATAAVAFVLGCALALPLAMASRRAPPPIAVERAPAAEPATGTERAPAGAPTTEPERALAAGDAVESAREPEAGRPGRAALARQMALEAFEAGRPRDGVGFFHIAVRARPWTPDDDVLVLYTIEALATPRAAPAAERLLRDLGEDARLLLEQTSETHPDRQLRARARAILAPPRPRPLLRWER